MKKTLFQKVICFILSATMLLSVFCMSVFADSEVSKRDPAASERNPYSASTLEEMQALVGTLSYAEYISSHSEQRAAYFSALKDPNVTFSNIPIENICIFTTDEANELNKGKYAQVVSENQYCTDSRAENPDAWADFGEDNYDNSVYLPAQGYATWQITLSPEQQGFYYIKIEYYSVQTTESSISTIERKFKIDDKVPFDEVSSIKFAKEWIYNNITTEEFDAAGQPNSYDVKYELVEEDGKQGYYKIVT